MKFTMFGKTYDVELIKNEYRNNGNVYLGLVTKETGELFCDLTVNIEPLLYGYATIDTWDIPNIGKFITKNKIGKFTGKVIKSGFCRYSLYELDMDRVDELAIN